jgi:RHS repeat-associated protein
LGRNVKIVEVTAGSTTSTKQFVWCKNEPCEERDVSGALVKQYFSRGEVISGTAYFFTKDHLGSIREMSHMSGGTFVLDSQFSFDPYGKPTQFAGTGATADFGYAGMYLHSRSALNLTLFRQYSASMGRWLSRDPVGERFGSNLYAYVRNEPISLTDRLGLEATGSCPADPPCGGPASGVCDCADQCAGRTPSKGYWTKLDYGCIDACLDGLGGGSHVPREPTEPLPPGWNDKAWYPYFRQDRQA